MSKSDDTQCMTVRLYPEHQAVLLRLEAEHGLSRSDLVRLAIEAVAAGKLELRPARFVWEPSSGV